MKKLLTYVIPFLVGFLLTTGVIKWEVHRWHVFQQYTHSEIGFWEWKFFVDGGIGKKHK
jgi:hypothetical protein